MNKTFFFQNEADLQSLLRLQRISPSQGDGLASMPGVMEKLSHLLVPCPACGHYSCGIQRDENEDPLAGTVWGEGGNGYHNGDFEGPGLVPQLPVPVLSTVPEGHALEVRLQMRVTPLGRTVLRLKINESSNDQDCLGHDRLGQQEQPCYLAE